MSWRPVRVGGAKGIRTPDPLPAEQVLYQLSYSPGCPGGPGQDSRSLTSCGNRDTVARSGVVGALDRLGERAGVVLGKSPARTSAVVRLLLEN